MSPHPSNPSIPYHTYLEGEEDGRGDGTAFRGGQGLGQHFRSGHHGACGVVGVEGRVGALRCSGLMFHAASAHRQNQCNMGLLLAALAAGLPLSLRGHADEKKEEKGAGHGRGTQTGMHVRVPPESNQVNRLPQAHLIMPPHKHGGG